MSHYKLRVTWSKTDCSFETFDKMIFTHCPKYCHVNEGDGERVEKHTHYYLITNVKEIKLRKLFRAALGTSGCKGNAVYSLSELAIEEDQEYAIEYLAYMTKEGTIFNDGIPPEVIEEATLHHKAVRANQRAERALKKSQLASLTELVQNNWNIPKDEFMVDKKGETLQVQSLVPFIVNYYKEQGVLFRQFAIIDICRTILLKLSPQYKDSLINSMIEILQK